MSTVMTGLMTAEEFFDFANRPENRGRKLELDRGRVVEMPSPGEIHGSVCWIVAVLFGLYVMKRGKGRATTNDTGLVVEEGPGTVRGPDLMFFDEVKPLGKLDWNHTRQIPTLVVEVVSPSDRANSINKRVAQYLGRGVSLVWIIDPEERTVGVHKRGELTRTLDETDELTGNDVLPDLKWRVEDLFKMPGEAAA